MNVLLHSQDELVFEDERKDWRKFTFIELAFLIVIPFITILGQQEINPTSLFIVPFLFFYIYLFLWPFILNFFLPKKIKVLVDKKKGLIVIEKTSFFNSLSQKRLKATNTESVVLRILSEIDPQFYLKKYFFRLTIRMKDDTNVNIDFSPIRTFHDNEQLIVDTSHTLAQLLNAPFDYNPKPIWPIKRILKGDKV